MGWKKHRAPKQSISSVTSMSFLAEQNLTFHRFSDGTISCDGKKNPLSDNAHIPQSTIWTTNATLDYSATNPVNNINESATSTAKILPSTIDESIDQNDGTPKRYSTYSVGNNSTYSSSVNNTQHNGSTMKLIQVQKDDSDSSSKQSRCSIFRGTILCLCMNMTYANIVRFPRELERHGFAFLVPYLTIMFIIGVPIVLLEMALGQFLGQGAAHSWKASPFFKGASIVGRMGAWIGCIWISMQMSLALLYIGQMSFSSVPFRQCPSHVQRDEHYEEVPVLGQVCLQRTFLRPISESSLSFGLLAIGLVFLWVIVMMCTHSSRVNRRSLMMFGMGALGLLLFQLGWQVSTTIQHEKFFPQVWPFHYEILGQSSTWFYALVQVIFSTQIGTGAIPVMTGKFLYKGDALRMCSVYMCFNFLITIMATAYYMTTFGQHNISSRDFPYFPDLTTLTSIYDRAFIEPHSSYLRSLIPSLAYLMIIFAGIVSISIAIYTASRLMKRHPNYIMCIAALCLSIAFLLCPNFRASQLLDMRWTGLIIICALIFDIISITWIYGTKDLSIDLEFSIGRPIMKLWLLLWSCIPLLLIAIITCFIALPSVRILTIEPIRDIIPKWIPLAVCVAIIILMAIYEVTKQVDYNTFNMIHEATKAAKDWGPADPIVRHAWKQWKTVCDDTGQRDFTLKRRGTKDWTNSIKKGQYSHGKHRNIPNCIGGNHKYTVNEKHLQTSSAASMTGGSNSPNYSGSVFGDSAIEEDISCGDKYSSNERDRKRNQSNCAVNRNESDVSCDTQHQVIRNYQKIPIRISTAVNENPLRIKRNSYLQANDNINDDDDDDDGGNDNDDYHHHHNNHRFASRIEILPPEFSSTNFPLPPPPSQFQAQSTFMQNPLCHINSTRLHQQQQQQQQQDDFYDEHHRYNNSRHKQQQQQSRNGGHLISNIQINGDIYSDGSFSTNTAKTLSTTATASSQNDTYDRNWRKLSVNRGDEYSTEL